MNYLERELIAQLKRVKITSKNVGKIRMRLFVPWNSKWNAFVRDETSKRENKP